MRECGDLAIEVNGQDVVVLMSSVADLERSDDRLMYATEDAFQERMAAYQRSR